jgi:Cu+-exporting ATPase
VTAAADRGLFIAEPEHLTVHPGLGVEAVVEGRLVRVGHPAWLAREGVATAALEQRIGALEAEGKTVVAGAVDGRLVGVLAVADREKPSASAAIAELHRLGIGTVMLTGDNERAARAIADRVGISEVVAGVLPDGKEEQVRRRQGTGRIVAMVGDGVNDAPALARSDVGIALGTGTDVALEASDVTLVGGDLGGVARAIRLSRATMRTIRQNLFWAFFYNVALIPLAAGALSGLSALPRALAELHPAMAALAMALSSVTVVLNSLRLNLRRL